MFSFIGKKRPQKEYQQYDLKVERYHVDYIHLTVSHIPNREDSYERLLRENRQFTSEEESVEDVAVKLILIEKMLNYLN